MKSETIIEVIEKLVGPTYPTGESHIDKLNKENQESIIHIADYCIELLIRNAEYKNRPEGSMSDIGEKAYEALKNFSNWINPIVEDCKE